MKNWRINVLFFLFLVYVGLIFYQLFSLQISKGDLARAFVEGLHTSPNEEIERGKIFFSKMEPLVLNKEIFLVFALPKKIKNPEEISKKLSEILKMDEKIILEKLKSNNSYQLIKEKLEPNEVERLRYENLEGVFLESKIGRFYPQGTLTSQVVGFVDRDGNGKYGLEEYYDEILKKGGSLILTLDYSLQFKAEELLKKAKDEFDIKSGQIVVIDPYSGKILAMANFPNFDPNEYWKEAKENLEIFKNRVTLEIFEPGSVFKPITMAIGLEEEKITPETKFTDKGFFQIGQIKIQNYGQRVWGEVTMTKVLENSINTGAVFVERQIPHPIFLDYLRKFGLFKKTGIDLPEIYSENKEFKKGYEINFATASFGQGIEMTPLQLTKIFCLLINGGRPVKPYVVEKIVYSDKIIEKRPEISERIISEKTSSQLKAMLLSVVENGFGKRAKIQGYYIAGKTGTSQIPYSSLGLDQKGYSDQTWQTFIGFFPAFNPRFLIMVKLDNPKTKTAEYSATPIFRELAEFTINYYQIPQDYEVD